MDIIPIHIDFKRYFGIHLLTKKTIILIDTIILGTTMKTLSAIFTDHPAAVSETYFQHFKFAMTFSGLLAYAAFAALAHALVPCLFEKTAGNIIRKMVSRMDNR